MLMPEAAVHEHDFAARREYKAWSFGQVFAVQAVANYQEFLFLGENFGSLIPRDLPLGKKSTKYRIGQVIPLPSSKI